MKKMILRIVLFLSYGMLVSSNNGYPVIPTQTYPIYQQNGYTNPSSNQPSDITPYLQNIMVQNQSPSLNLSPSNIRQILLNRILSNQPIQTIVDQNSIGSRYGSSLVEYPNNPVAANPVSNYVNIPSTGANKEEKAADNKTEEKRKKNKKRKTSKSKKIHKESENNQNTSNKNKINDLEDNDKQTSKKTKKRSRKPKTEDSAYDNQTSNSENESNKKTKKKKRKNKESEAKKPINEETAAESPKPRRRRKKKPKLDTDNTEKDATEQQTTPKPNQIQEGINLAYFNEGIVEENRVPRNPIPEENYLLKSIPNLPENFANSFNFKGLPQFNNPTMSNFFGNYENLYQSMMSNNKGVNNQREIIRRKPQKPRNNSKRKTEVKNRNSTSTTEATVSTNSKPTVSPKINVVTTEKTVFIKEKTRTNINPVLTEESLKSIDKPSDVKETTIQKFEREEFGVENDDIKDIEPNMNDYYSDGYIDDYYPQFTDSAAYTANKREVYIKNLGDTKYYYAVDKGNPEFINRMRFEGFGLPKSVVKDYEVNKKYDDAEIEGAINTLDTDNKDNKEEEVQFRSPPHLELPDFQTRQVGRTEINPETYSHLDEKDDFDPRFSEDKASIYSEAKVPYYTGTKENNKKELKDKHKGVETVFAKSKVANYGPVYKPNPEEDSTFVGTSNQGSADHSSDLKDGGTTYVFATPLDYTEHSW